VFLDPKIKNRKNYFLYNPDFQEFRFNANFFPSYFPYNNCQNIKMFYIFLLQNSPIKYYVFYNLSFSLHFFHMQNFVCKLKIDIFFMNHGGQNCFAFPTPRRILHAIIHNRKREKERKNTNKFIQKNVKCISWLEKNFFDKQLFCD
jgi:hypothetical protein